MVSATLCSSSLPEVALYRLVLQSSAAHVAGIIWPAHVDVVALTERLGGISITDIQGTSFLSPYAGKTVESVVGTVTAKVHPTLRFHTVSRLFS